MEIIKLLSEKYLLWAIVLVLLVNLYQKRNGDEGKLKRYATLTIAFLLLVFNIICVLIIEFKLPVWTVYIGIVLTLALAFVLRKYLNVFSLKCKACKKSLDVNQMLGSDDNICSNCKSLCIDDIDWDSWQPSEVCTLSYVLDNNKVLLIEKKLGLGKDLVNGPGGHVEENETIEEATIRECKEETNLDISDLEYKGVLDFHFLTGLKMRGHIYITRTFKGEIKESDEAKPFWCDLDKLPLDRMWEDDKLWLEDVLKGKTVNAKFIFNGEKMLDSKVKIC